MFSVLLILAAQWLLMAVSGSAETAAVAIPFLGAALLLAIPGYAWALRGGAFGLRMESRIARITVVGFTSVALSLAGAIIGWVIVVGNVRPK
jgi:hypothetical protein